MANPIYAKMTSDAAVYWQQSLDWITVVETLLGRPMASPLSGSTADEVRALCRELAGLRCPSDGHVGSLRRLANTINPTPSDETLQLTGGPDCEEVINTIVQQYGARPEALALRRSTLAYRYLSIIIDGLQQRRGLARPSFNS